MSIASRITSIENHIEEAYTEISRLGVDLTNVDKNIDNIADKLQDVYADLPKVTGEGSSLSLTPTRKGGLSIIPKGACEQDSYSGKNLFNKNTLALGKNWNGSIRTTCYPFSNQSTRAVILVEVQPSTTYAISLYESEWYCMQILDCDENYVVTKDSYLSEISNSFEVTMTTRSTAKYIGLKFKYGSDGTTVMTESLLSSLKMQVEQNNAVTPYEQYVGGIPAPNPDYPQDIRVVTGNNSVVVQNKNLIIRTLNEPITQYDVTITPNSNGSYTINGTANATKNIEIGYFIPTKDEYYTISGVENYTLTDIRLAATSTAFPSGHILSEYVDAGSTRRTRVAYTNESTPILLQITNGSIYDNVTIYPMIEQNNQVTEFIKAQNQIYTLHLGSNYLAGIGDYKDEIVGKTDEWKIKRYIGKVILNGSETYWNIGGAGTSIITKRFYGNNNLSVDNVKVFSNYFIDKGYTWNKIQTCDEELIAYSNNYLQIRISVEKATTVAEFKTWLSNHNTIVYYALPTATETPITDTTLITDLNNMYQAMGYDGTTNITITSVEGNAQMIAQVSALKGE